MRRKITANSVYKKLIILLLSFGLFSCSTTERPVYNKSSNLNSFNEFFENSSSTQNNGKPVSSEEALAGALEAEQKGDLDKALYYYIQSLLFDPENAAVFLKIAQNHEQRGNDSIAVRAYSEAVKNDPSLILAYQGLGIINMEMRKYKQAQEYLQKAIILDQKRLGELGAEKEGEYYPLDKESPTNSYNALGILEDMYGNFELARTYYNLALNANENSANVLSNIGYSYYLAGKLNSAERYFKRAINVDNQHKRAWTNLGLIYIQKGQYNRAVKTLKQVIEEFEAYNELGYFLMLDGHLEQAEYFFQKAINMSPRYYEKAYSNLEQVRIKKHELSMLENEAQGEEAEKVALQAGYSSIWSGISAEMALENGN